MKKPFTALFTLCLLPIISHALPQQVALTFDDSPTPWTISLVTTLAADSIPATFFVVGRQISAHQFSLETALANNCSLGNHTWSHPYLGQLSFGQLSTELTKTTALCQKLFSIELPYARIPYNDLSHHTKRKIQQLGYQQISWDIDSRDWERPRAAFGIITTALAKQNKPAIILMHDRAGTVKYLPQLLTWLKEQKIQCLPLEQILALKQSSHPTKN